MWSNPLDYAQKLSTYVVDLLPVTIPKIDGKNKGSVLKQMVSHINREHIPFDYRITHKTCHCPLLSDPQGENKSTCQ